MTDSGCICKGNWREIVKESESLFGKRYGDEDGREYIFIGIVHVLDDYYYLMVADDGHYRLGTCVGSLETNGYTLLG